MVKSSEERSEIRVAVIDDDPIVVGTAQRFLQTRGYTTLGMTEVIGCSNVIRKFRPHIILLDIQMPAIRGDKLIDILRSNLERMPRIIIFSGLPTEELRRVMEETDADDFINKRDGFQKMLNKVDAHVEVLPVSDNGAGQDPARN